MKTKEKLTGKGAHSKSQISLNAAELNSPDKLRVSISKNDIEIVTDHQRKSVHNNFLKPVIKQKSGKKLLKIPSTGEHENLSGSAVTKGGNDTSIVMSEKNQTVYLLGSNSNTF